MRGDADRKSSNQQLLTRGGARELGTFRSGARLDGEIRGNSPVGIVSALESSGQGKVEVCFPWEAEELN